jgi:hypothetical protein
MYTAASISRMRLGAQTFTFVIDADRPVSSMIPACLHFPQNPKANCSHRLRPNDHFKSTVTLLILPVNLLSRSL